MQIVIVDDDENIRSSLMDLLSESYNTIEFSNAMEAYSYLEVNNADLVITDHRMPEMTGVELLAKVKTISPDTSFFLMTAYASIQQAVEALQKGAEDYIMKPFDLEEMELRVNKIRRLRTYTKMNTLSQASAKGTSRLVGKSKCIDEAKKFIEKIADVPSSVLILGPTGSGKEVFGTTIHEVSNRSSMPFVAINCATLSDQLIESELFGHEKGSFTGATEMKQGKFELANGGTIFLDEIGELSIDLQAKLLRVLQEREFYRIGGNKLVKSDVRVIAATHQNLEELVTQGRFREDLLYRLNILVFNLLPLSERKDDIEPVAHYLWNSLKPELNRNTVLTEEVISALKGYNWPGNVRQLKNVLERMMVLGPKDGDLTIDLLPPEISIPSSNAKSSISMTSSSKHVGNIDLDKHMQTIEFEIIKEVYLREEGNQIKTAQALGLKRGTLQYKLKKMAELKLIP